MSEAIKFTPGPWIASRRSDADRTARFADGSPIYDVYCAPRSILAYVVPEPDAHLIAAAPDLYAALEQTRKALEVATTPLRRDRLEVVEAQKAARAALAKARGAS